MLFFFFFSLSLLSSQQPFNVALLDQIVVVAFNPHDPNRAAANTCLMSLKDCPSLWTRADQILEASTNPNTLFFGLQILDDTIRTRWKILPPEQRDGIKNYIVTKVIKMSSSEANLSNSHKNQGTKVFINKLNLTLIQVLKQEWPHNWPTFISDLVGASKTSEVLCENNMNILKLLSEEVFDFSKEAMTTAKVTKMKESLNGEFSSIYQLCEYILKNSKRPSLLKVTLQTLQRFLTWIPLGFIFQTDLIHMLLDSFFSQPAYRNDALECLAEIGTLTDLEPQYDTLFQSLYLKFMARLGEIFKPETDLADAYEKGSDEDGVFIQRLALFFCGFFRVS